MNKRIKKKKITLEKKREHKELTKFVRAIKHLSTRVMVSSVPPSPSFEQQCRMIEEAYRGTCEKCGYTVSDIVLSQSDHPGVIIREAAKTKKTGILERRYASKSVISEIMGYNSSVVRGHRLTKEESDLVAIQDPVDTVDILIEPILTRRALNGFESAVCVMKKEEENGKERVDQKKIEEIKQLVDKNDPTHDDIWPSEKMFTIGFKIYHNENGMMLWVNFDSEFKARIIDSNKYYWKFVIAINDYIPFIHEKDGWNLDNIEETETNKNVWHFFESFNIPLSIGSVVKIKCCITDPTSDRRIVIADEWKLGAGDYWDPHPRSRRFYHK